MLQPLLKFGTEPQLVRVFLSKKKIENTHFTRMRHKSSITVVVKLANHNSNSKRSTLPPSKSIHTSALPFLHHEFHSNDCFVSVQGMSTFLCKIFSTSLSS